MPELRPFNSRGEGMGCLDYEIFRNVAASGADRSADGQHKTAAGGKAQNVGGPGEGNEAVNVVIAIGATADDTKRQIDFGVGLFGARRRHHQPPPGFLFSASAADDVSSESPDFSLASILTRSSGSGLRSRACDHWKR